MHHVHLAADARKVNGVGSRRVAAAHHHHVAVAEEVPVAGGAVGYAATRELVLKLQPQTARASARGNNHAFRPIFGKRGSQNLRLHREIDGRDLFFYMLGSKAVGLLLHGERKLEAVRPFGKAGVVVHMFRLSQLPAGNDAFENSNGKPGASSIQPRRKPRRACPYHCHVQHIA